MATLKSASKNEFLSSTAEAEVEFPANWIGVAYFSFL
jgi:hypothetical protein